MIPAEEVAVITDNIGLPNNINLALSDNVMSGRGRRSRGPQAEHGPTAEYLKTPAAVAASIPRPGVLHPARGHREPDPELRPAAPIDIQISGPIQENDQNYQVAQRIAHELSGVPGAVDVHVSRSMSSPRIMIDTDRQVAQQVGLTSQDVANSVSISLSGSGTATTNFWLNYKNGVRYPVVVQTEPRRVRSMDDLHRMPIANGGQAVPQLLGNLATLSRTTTPLSLSHYNVQPVFDVYANVQGTDLGSVSDAVDTIIAKHEATLSKASTITVRGQVQSMKQSFFQMALGICFAILLVYPSWS